MGFGFRQSFGSGPFRFTVSPSGVSSSFGVGGARITAGPRGTFVTVSSHGVSYRHRLDGLNPTNQQATEPEQYTEPPMDSVFQVPIAELATSNQDELVAKLTANAEATNPAIFVGILALACLGLITVAPIVAITAAILGLILCIVVSNKFKATHTLDLHYSLDPVATKRFEHIQDSLSKLAQCSAVWTVNTQSQQYDWKRNAGASSSITRTSAAVGHLPTKGFKPSMLITSIKANDAIFHFMPDTVLLLSGGKYAAISYQQLSLQCSATRFIEEGSVPSDSRAVGSTWRFVNKAGGPDRRFNNNRQLPVLQYGELKLSTANGLHVILQTSSYEKGAAFVNGWLNPASGVNEASHHESRTPPTTPARNQTLKAAYELLGLVPPCTPDQANTAHRQQALLYHPDRYEHLAPEMKELASQRMIAINAAYVQVKADIQ